VTEHRPWTQDLIALNWPRYCSLINHIWCDVMLASTIGPPSCRQHEFDRRVLGDRVYACSCSQPVKSCNPAQSEWEFTQLGHAWLLQLRAAYFSFVTVQNQFCALTVTSEYALACSDWARQISHCWWSHLWASLMDYKTKVSTRWCCVYCLVRSLAGPTCSPQNCQNNC